MAKFEPTRLLMRININIEKVHTLAGFRHENVYFIFNH